ncbi:dual specificity tyrosine-phosphorylation-regulated kinase 2-like [Lethenteron reissneri]|uniref:dual specificity tyrosine-phosphorylation-regulated kinase 2-like n=1 Tax=Lethenteron reissneri TaxID=7753 RepID=UPI002AB6BD2F|nr:dual specificity tyrosine-phosphorylation-regulated kinase 2-like [Lethenteron reissneri]
MGMVKTYTRGILKFLCHTKARSIIHADIKPENVLIKDTVTGTIRVTDFGTSFFVKSQHRVGMMFCPVKRRVPGSLSLHGALNSHDPEFVEFVSSCLRWDPDCRMTPAQALGHSWLRTAATSTTRNATTTATPGSVQCFGAAERR